MARTSQISTAHFTIFLVLSIFITLNAAMEDKTDFLKPIDKKMMGKFMKKEKLSHFRLYWHDIVAGKNPSSVEVVPGVTNSNTSFGLINMIDNPLTVGPELTSKMVGKAQGFYASTSQENIELLMAQNFAFSEGKYNGSTITILGRNPIFSEVREMPVIGGSGLFRFARGYVEARTHWLDLKTKDAIVRYDFYVMHY